ncbi:MAG: ATP-dependent RNA helicase DBP3 [Lasallia pustulata]|uniref:RNA helicase n=1 Tax=Lasallia pustulata TaxID=136370 RepID=A0A5M8PD00_9LECA|nr:MAG: ATP-dependent RNA helicase DBP3 [Lasallia pustulata]
MPKRPIEEADASADSTVAKDVAQSTLKRRKTKDNPSAQNSVSDEAKKKLSKEERRVLSKAKKTKENGIAAAVEGTESKDVDGSDASSEKAAAKAARKAEKARLKVLEKSDSAKKKGTHSKFVEKANGVSANGGDIQKATPSHSNYTEDPALTTLPQSDIDTFLSSNFIAIDDPKSTSKPLRPITDFAYLHTTSSAERAPFASFKTPTPIQAAAWPFLFSGRDVIGVAETGSGKTLAFGVPCIRYINSCPSLQKFRDGSKARAVIVSPTRELAVQIHEQIVQLATPAGLQAACVYGGVPKDPQRLALKAAHVVVATPGRLNDLINEGVADLSGVGYLVLDEADRMLDKGFEEEIRKIISTTPSTEKGRQTLMFTATWPQSVRELAATFMTQPVKIAIGDNPTGELRANTRIVQRVEVVDPRGKESRLLQLIKQYQSGKAKDDRILVFCLYKKEAARVEGFLRTQGLRVAGIHGDLSQHQRQTSLDAFKSGKVPLLVATDVAARGLDIPAVKLVLNVTFPLTVEDYVHRIGRTGRAGKEGLAVTLFTEHDKAQSGALINVLKAANQPVPDELLRFGTTVKKKGHDAYGAFYKDADSTKAATKIKFDD